MIRAVLDANIYVSAAIRPEGTPGQIIARFLRDACFELILSPSISDEILRALSYPKIRRYFHSDFQPASWLEDIVLCSALVSGELELSGVSRDPDDDKYIAAAIEGRADFIVAGDLDLLSVREYRDIRIVSPRSFLRLLEG